MGFALGLLIGGIVAGVLVAYFSYRKINHLNKEGTSLKTQLSVMSTKIDDQQKAMEKEISLLDEAKEKFSDAFKVLSADALKSSNEEFLRLAETTLEKFQEGAKDDLENCKKAIEELVKLLKDSLEKVDGNIRKIEKVRATAYISLTEQIKTVADTEAKLLKETGNLASGLRTLRDKLREDKN